MNKDRLREIQGVLCNEIMHNLQEYGEVFAEPSIENSISAIESLYAEENHCKDCCCAQSWKALGVTEYTGKSIPEHIQELKQELFELKGG